MRLKRGIVTWLTVILTMVNLTTLTVNAEDSGNDETVKGYYVQLVENVTPENVNEYRNTDIEKAIEILKLKEELTAEEAESLETLMNHAEESSKGGGFFITGLVVVFVTMYFLVAEIGGKGRVGVYVLWGTLLVVGILVLSYGLFYPELYGLF